MNYLNNSILFVLFLLPMSLIAQHGQFDVRLTEHLLDCNKNKYYVDIEIKATDATTHFALANQNYRFTFNTAAIQNPKIEQELDVSGSMNINGYTASYAAHNTSGSQGSTLSYNVNLDSGTGILLDDSRWIPVGRISFHIVDADECMDLVWLKRNSPLGSATYISEKHANVIYEVKEGDYSNLVSCPEFNLHVLLEGPYNINTGEMGTGLNIQGLLPWQLPASAYIPPTLPLNPYAGDPWFYPFPDSVINYHPDVVDWVMVELRSDHTEKGVLFQQTGLLYKDGHIEMVGETRLPKSAKKQCYVAIHHRNHLPVMSPQQTIFKCREFTYDFRIEDSFTVVGFGQKQIRSGLFAMYTGNMQAGDSQVNGKDNTEWLKDNGAFFIYSQADVDLDGNVNGRDRMYWSNNNGFYSNVE